MTNQGSGNNGEWTFLDLLGFASFLIGLQNLDLNIDQNYMDEIINDIHSHLHMQDEKIDEILRRLEDDNSRNIFENK
jgi:hypothetical protein